MVGDAYSVRVGCSLLLALWRSVTRDLCCDRVTAWDQETCNAVAVVDRTSQETCMRCNFDWHSEYVAFAESGLTPHVAAVLAPIMQRKLIRTKWNTNSDRKWLIGDKIHTSFWRCLIISKKFWINSMVEILIAVFEFCILWLHILLQSLVEIRQALQMASSHLLIIRVSRSSHVLCTAMRATSFKASPAPRSSRAKLMGRGQWTSLKCTVDVSNQYTWIRCLRKQSIHVNPLST